MEEGHEKVIRDPAKRKTTEIMSKTSDRPRRGCGQRLKRRRRHDRGCRRWREWLYRHAQEHALREAIHNVGGWAIRSKGDQVNGLKEKHFRLATQQKGNPIGQEGGIAAGWCATSTVLGACRDKEAKGREELSALERRQVILLRSKEHGHGEVKGEWLK